VPLALLTVLLILLWVPKDQPRTADFVRLVQEVDLIGIGLFGAFLLSLMTSLMNPDRSLWLGLLAAAVFGAALVGHSLRRRQPFLDVRMLARNRPLIVTYLRAGAVSMIVLSVYYGFAQWLQSAIGLSSATAGLVTLPMSVVAAVSSLTGARSKGLRAPFLVSIGAALFGCICLFVVDSRTSVWIIVIAFMFFGVPMGMFSTATQAAVYIQAPVEEIGTAAGLQRTAQYIGAIAGAGLLALLYGQHATDPGLHSLAAVMGTVSALLFIATLFDRTIPRVAPAAVLKAAVSDRGDIGTRQPKGKTMPLTQLDTAAALVVIDLQKGIIGLPAVHPIGEIVGRAARLARAFRERGLPVVLVNVAGLAPGRTDAGPPKFSFPADWTELVPQLEQHPGDHLVTKQRLGAFIGTSLDGYLRQHGVTQVVLSGVATSSGVESTARSAYDLGYNVALVVDAMTDLSAEAHCHSVEKVFPRLGETGTTADVLKLLKDERM
jgi:nicotinamidase-related amidase